MEEEWRVIPGFEGLYEASSFGRIRSVDGRVTNHARWGHRKLKQVILSQKVQTRGNGRSDARVELWKDGEHKTYLVSRLVALAFCQMPELTVNHKNGNSMDNRAENLEWVTGKENINHAVRTGLFHKCQKEITLIDDDTLAEYHFKSYSEASRFLGRFKGYVSQAMVRDHEHHFYNVDGKGYSHKFDDTDMKEGDSNSKNNHRKNSRA